MTCRASRDEVTIFEDVSIDVLRTLGLGITVEVVVASELAAVSTTVFTPTGRVRPMYVKSGSHWPHNGAPQTTMQP